MEILRHTALSVSLLVPCACNFGPPATSGLMGPEDAGLVRDAVTTDANAPDTSEPADAGLPDAARADAGDVQPDLDAGASDGPVGPSDGAVLDGAFVDAALPDAAVPDSGPPDTGFQSIDLTDVALYVNLGDSVADGRNADNDRGYADLLYENHAAYPSYAGHDLLSRSASVVFDNRGDGGGTSSDAVDQVDDLPSVSSGSVVVTTYVGGNDIQERPWLLLSDRGAQRLADDWVVNMDEVVTELETTYAGVDLHIIVATVHDPTDGTGTLPFSITSFQCAIFSQIPEDDRATVMRRFNLLNEAIRDFAHQRGLRLMDAHRLLLGHGVNAPEAQRWVDDDCIHLTNEGHHQLRRGYWEAMTGSVHY